LIYFSKTVESFSKLTNIMTVHRVRMA